MPSPLSEDPTHRHPPRTPLSERETIQTGKTTGSDVELTTWYPGQDIDGLYRIEREIARGGMGVVYEATDLATQNRVVIKTLLPDISIDEAFRQRFIREAEAWVRLGAHPNIVRAFTAIEANYSPCVIAEFVHGGTLAQALKKSRPPAKDAFRIAVQICHGMSYAHDKGLAHRDLKPGNVMLDEKGTAKITDFGLVKQLDDAQGETREVFVAAPNSLGGTLLTQGVLGTPEYIAPEQWDGQGGKPADIYAFGIILYELFAGKRPFEHSTADGLERLAAYHKSHTQEPLPSPKELIEPSEAGKLPDDLVNLMRQCLAKKPEQRPASFTELADRINAIGERITGEIPQCKIEARTLAAHEKVDQGYGLLRLAFGCTVRGDYNKASELLEEAREIFKSCGHKEGIAEFHLGMGRLLFLTSRYDESMQQLQPAMEIFQKAGNASGAAKCRGNMALVHKFQYRTDLSNALLKENLEVYKKLGDKRGVAKCLEFIAENYKSQKRIDDSAKPLAEAQAIYREHNDLAGMALTLFYQAETSYDLHKIEETLQLAGQSLELQQTIGKKMGVANCLTLQARCLTLQGNEPEAIAKFNRAIAIYTDRNNTFNIALAYRQLAEANMTIGKLDSALPFLQQSLVIAQRHKLHGLACNIHLQTSLLFAAKNDHARAMYHATEAKTICMEHNLGDTRLQQIEEQLTKLKTHNNHTQPPSENTP